MWFRRFSPVLICLALGACQDTGASDEVDPFAPPTEQEIADCAASGGYIGSGGLMPWACRYDLSDGGQACTRSTDCEGMCLVNPEANRGECAAVSPVFGCVGMLDERGERVEICID
ncbi:hypothetical protein N0B44_23515 [Roseibacterium beibuensis]|uniref:Secreted protein n=1 Tax=[Roseibacterium] beibuensis TaxID=1193142 RepID=A0ABP9LHY0_9RHOB|nr:hypothetical protein [Roseibacterium beibuensis]MCS6625889.1 hypothetical protein [Roseibacterium beibuensis]